MSTGAVAFSPLKLFLVFLRIGSILFGSGYVLLAFLRADLVERLHWLTEKQLIDAVAVGQLTPGPVFSTATFIGYVVGGSSGAALATLGIFLPSFFLVAVSGALIPRVRRFRTGASLPGRSERGVARVDGGGHRGPRASGVRGCGVGGIRHRERRPSPSLQVNSAWLVIGGAALGLILKRA